MIESCFYMIVHRIHVIWRVEKWCNRLLLTKSESTISMRCSSAVTRRTNDKQHYRYSDWLTTAAAAGTILLSCRVVVLLVIPEALNNDTLKRSSRSLFIDHTKCLKRKSASTTKRYGKTTWTNNNKRNLFSHKPTKLTLLFSRIISLFTFSIVSEWVVLSLGCSHRDS